MCYNVDLIIYNQKQMYTIENLKASITHEINVIKHLFSKIPEGQMGYKPTEKQRTMLELLKYLSGLTPATIAMVYTAEPKAFMDIQKVATETVTPENFIEKLESGVKDAMTMLDKFTDEDLNTVVNIFAMGDKTKGVYLVDTIGKWLAAYKLQLFLYIKSSGNTSIGTSNVWGGYDMEN